MIPSNPIAPLSSGSEAADTRSFDRQSGRRSDRLSPVAGEPRCGDRLGPYYLQELVGEGGMGRVFRAVHERLGRQVAIKLLRRNASYGIGVGRFLREARVVNRVRHPGLVEITDIVEAMPGGDSYYVMEWLEGKNLHERALEQRGHLPQPELLRILIDVAGTLHAVHEAGLVHRDLKPENIFLVAPEKPGAPERVKVIDFGVALDLRDPHAIKEDEIVGTPAYVSPEQARGEAVDRRSDIYALGVILYELSVGRLPFEARSALDALALRMEAQPPRPRKAAPRGVRVSRPLERVILRCMAEAKEDRYESMAALRADLEALLRRASRGRLWQGVPALGARVAPVVLLGATVGGLMVVGDAALPRMQALWQGARGRIVREPQADRPGPIGPQEPVRLEVVVKTTPAGAEVRHRGAVLGTTPCVVRLPEGRQELELRRAGYRRERRTIDVRVGAQLSVKLSR